MSIKKVKTKNGEIKWEVRAHESGRGSKRINKRFDKKTDAELFIHELKNKIIENANNPFKGNSFDNRFFKDEAEYWMNDGLIRFSQSHLVRVKGILKELLPYYGDMPIEIFTPQLLSKFQQTEKSKGSANATINRKTEVIIAILNCSEKHRRIPFSPAKGFKKLPRGTKELCFLSQHEALNFLACMDKTYPENNPKRWVYISYLIALNTGIRAGELWGLKPMDLAQDGKSFVIRRQFNRVTQSFTETKGKNARRVPCQAIVFAEVQKWILRNKIRSDETLFFNDERKPINHDNFSDRQFGKDLKLWGRRRIRFHDLRHTAITLMIANGVNIKTVQDVAGHTDIDTTMMYVHLISGSVENLSESFVIGAKADSINENNGLKVAGL